MDKLKKWIIIIMCLTIILIIITVILINYSKSEIEESGEAIDISEDIEKDILVLDDYDKYYSIEKNLQRYYLYLKVGNKDALLAIFDDNYKKSNDINKNNVIEKTSSLNIGEKEFRIREIYVKRTLDDSIYFINLHLKEDSNKKMYYIMYEDFETNSFSLIPTSEDVYSKYISNGNANDLKIGSSKQTNYNKIIQAVMSDEDIAEKYFLDYIQNALHNQEEAYNNIDEEYKKAKFKDFQAYKEYVNKNYKRLSSMDYNSLKSESDFETEEQYIEYINNVETKGLDKYSINKKDGYTQYVCVDKYGCYYVFNATSPFNYKLLLDTYTIDTPEFIENYNSSTEEEKININIQYIKENLYDINKIAYRTKNKTGDVYIYGLIISDGSGVKRETLNKDIIMQLKEGTDFVMSFNIK